MAERSDSSAVSSNCVQGNGTGGFFGMDPQVPERRPDRQDLSTCKYGDSQNVVLRLRTLKESIEPSNFNKSENNTYSQIDISLDDFAALLGSEGAGVDLVLWNPLCEFLSLLENGDFSSADKKHRSICRESKIFRKFNKFLTSIKFIMKRLRIQSESSAPCDQQNLDNPVAAPQRGRRRARPRPRVAQMRPQASRR